jgi:photosystem II stability/assembly factor-like uncharacterized protein
MRALILILACLSAVRGAWISIGPDGDYVQALAIDPRQPDTVYAALYGSPANSRLFRSTEAGAGWGLAGLLPYPQVRCVTVDPFIGSVLYARLESVLCRSTDAGATWAEFNAPGFMLGFVPDPRVEGRLYAHGETQHGGYYVAALFVSTNRGETWSVSMPNPDTPYVAYECAADPSRAGRVYIGGTEGHLQVTTDAGATWMPANSGIPRNAAVSGLSVSRDGSAVIAATNWGVYHSTDNGATWALAGGLAAPIITVRFSPADANRAWALGWGDSMRVFVSTDKGATWQRPTPGYATTNKVVLFPDPGTGATAWLSTPGGIYRSTDMGSTWHTAHAGLRTSSITTIAAVPRSERMYVGALRAGVFKTSDLGASWARCNDFLSCGSVCGIGVQPDRYSDILYALEGAG